MVIRIASIMLILSAFVTAQESFQASGQTEVFTLAPGAKAAWDKGASSVRHQRIIRAKPLLLNVRYTAGGVLTIAPFPVTSPAKYHTVSLFDLRGRCISRKKVIAQSGRINLSQQLRNGRYIITVAGSGISPATLSIMVMR